MADEKQHPAMDRVQSGNQGSGGQPHPHALIIPLDRMQIKRPALKSDLVRIDRIIAERWETRLNETGGEPHG